MNTWVWAMLTDVPNFFWTTQESQVHALPALNKCALAVITHSEELAIIGALDLYERQTDGRTEGRPRGEPRHELGSLSINN